MSEEKLPKHYVYIKENFPQLVEAVNAVGKAASQGPLDAKTLQLVQLAGSAARLLEGGTQSHVRRAIAAGATPEEIRHTVLALTSTLGFPTAATALAWVEEELSR